MTDLAGVQRAHQEAGTAEKEVVAAESAGEESGKDAMKAAGCFRRRAPSAKGRVSRGLCSRRSPSARPSGAIASSAAATAKARSGVNLLALKLEAITTFYGNWERDRYEDLPQAYTVNWAAELGQGTYGKVYVATKGLATGLHRDERQGGFAVKMLRDKEPDEPKGFHADAVRAADLEVRRHVAPGLRPNAV